jgi:hypothetical protein
MPKRTPKSLRAAIAQHAPQLLVDFDRHWRRDIADAYDLAPVPAFMTRWWNEYALARNPELEARVHRLEDEAAHEGNFTRAKAMIEEAGRIRRTATEHDCVEWGDAAARLDPGTASADTAIVIRYSNSLAVRLTRWELDVYEDHIEVEGRLAPGTPLLHVGAAVKVAQLDIPGRAALVDLTASIALVTGEDVHLKLTAPLAVDR